jgi:hypothetical protein
MHRLVNGHSFIGPDGDPRVGESSSNPGSAPRHGTDRPARLTTFPLFRAVVVAPTDDAANGSIRIAPLALRDEPKSGFTSSMLVFFAVALTPFPHPTRMNALRSAGDIDPRRLVHIV